MATKKRPKTWLEVAVMRGGMRNAIRGISWAFTWAVARERLGHDPTVEEVAEWWSEPVRTAYREQASFRTCFPTLDSPAPIYENEQARDAVRRFAKASADFEEAVQKKNARVDRAVLTIGMLTATVS